MRVRKSKSMNRAIETVVITGASAGVGRAVAQKFAKHGAHIALLARSADGLEAARKEVEEVGGKAITIIVDVADAEHVEAAAVLHRLAIGQSHRRGQDCLGFARSHSRPHRF